jgi:hypothetical protein
MGTLSRENSTSNPHRAPRAAVKTGTWRERAHSHYQNILALLRERGPAGVLSSELYNRPEKFGRSPRNRISEARAAGLNIETIPLPHGLVRYILREEQHRSPVVPRESTTEDLPLFAGVER